MKNSRQPSDLIKCEGVYVAASFSYELINARDVTHMCQIFDFVFKRTDAIEFIADQL